jgi:TetR/AcrR family transcriptional repressor of nem operon
MMGILFNINEYSASFERGFMRYPAEETAEKHERILEQASKLFRERGFYGVSVSEVMKASHLTHGAFYNHFESKDDLIAKTIGDASSKALASMKEAEHTPEAMQEYIQNYLTEWHRNDPGTGCLMTALASEVAREPSVQPAFTRHLKGVIASLMAPFAKSKKRNVRRDAIHKISSMVGAIVLARAVDDAELSEEILREVRNSLE